MKIILTIKVTGSISSCIDVNSIDELRDAYADMVYDARELYISHAFSCSVDDASLAPVDSAVTVDAFDNGDDPDFVYKGMRPFDSIEDYIADIRNDPADALHGTADRNSAALKFDLQQFAGDYHYTANGRRVEKTEAVAPYEITELLPCIIDLGEHENIATLVNIKNGKYVTVDLYGHSPNWKAELKAIGARSLRKCYFGEYQLDWFGDVDGTANEITDITDNFTEEDFMTLNAALDAELRYDFIELCCLVRDGKLELRSDVDVTDELIYGGSGVSTVYGWLEITE